MVTAVKASFCRAMPSICRMASERFTMGGMRWLKHVPRPTVSAMRMAWKAATVQNPKPHYFAPRSARTAVRMFAMMPHKLAERILRGMYKWELPRKPDA